MATTTATPTHKELLKQRDALIAQFEEETARAEAAKAAGDKKEAASANARKANRSREISQLQLDMALAGVKFDAWAKPKATRTGNGSSPSRSQEEIQTDLNAVASILNGDFPESVKDTADKRVTALLKQAEKAGYEIADPRS